MTRLVLVRHAETVWHDENCYAGSTDVALSDRGVAETARLAEWARTAGLAETWASPLARARATAGPCAEAAGTALRTDERLRELDFGLAEGLTPDEMRERLPDERAAFEHDPVAGHLPGGEDPVGAAERFVACLLDIAEAHSAGRVLVVSHTTVVRLGLCRLIGVPLRDYRRLFPSLHNCGRTEISR